MVNCMRKMGTACVGSHAPGSLPDVPVPTSRSSGTDPSLLYSECRAGSTNQPDAFRGFPHPPHGTLLALPQAAILPNPFKFTTVYFLLCQ
jgi:hypothetical protein